MFFGCIHVPDFSVQASLCAKTTRAETTPAETAAKISFQADPIAVLDGPESLLKVYACNERARSAGIALGMTKIQAEACPGVVLRKRIGENEEEAQAALLECAYSFSPRVESTCPGSSIVDLTGAERLLGSLQEMGQQLSDRVRAQGFTVNVGIAATADTALHAARGFAGITVIDAGEEAKRLAGLPVEVLEPLPEILDTLESWGIRDFRSLAALPAVPLTQRLGQPGLHLQRLARGEVQRELVPAELPPSFQACAELEEALDLLEPLGFVLNRLLEELMDRLRTRSLATDQVHVDLELEVHPDRQLQTETLPGSAAGPTPPRENSAWQGPRVMPLHHRALKLPVSTQDTKVLLKLLQLDLTAHPPQAPVKKVRVEVFPARIRLTQAGLFHALAPEPAKLEITMARLRATVGEKDDQERQRVGFPMVADSHRPGSFHVLPCRAEGSRASRKEKRTQEKQRSGEQKKLCDSSVTPTPVVPSPQLPITPASGVPAAPQLRPITSTPGVPGAPQLYPITPTSGVQEAPQLVMRWFRPPLAAWVECALTQPAAIVFNGMRASVVQASGPWRSGGDWWDHAGQWQREEWDVNLSFVQRDGASGLYRIFRDLLSGQWFVEGIYD